MCESDGQLLPGDRLVSLNAENLANVSHSTALHILKKPTEQATIVVLREEQKENKTEDSNVSIVQVHTPRLVPPPKPPREGKHHQKVKNSTEQLIENKTSNADHAHSDKEEQMPPSPDLPPLRASQQTRYESVPVSDEEEPEKEPEKEPLLVPQPSLPPFTEGRAKEHLLHSSFSKLDKEESWMVVSDSQTGPDDTSNDDSTDFTETLPDINNIQSKPACVAMDTTSKDESPVVAMEMTELKIAGNNQFVRPLIGRRHESRPFVIEFDKKYRSLGMSVSLDGQARLMVSEVSSFGLVGKDGNIRFVCRHLSSSELVF